MRGLELAYHNGGMGNVRSGDGVGVGTLNLSAEEVQCIFGLCELLSAIRALHGYKHPADLHKWQAQLAQDIQAGNRS